MLKTKSVTLKCGIIFGLVALSTGCASIHSAQLAYKCNSDLTRTNAELEKTKIEGFGSTVAWTKAASLLTEAKIQQQFNKYPICINIAARARYYIGRSKSI